MPLTRLEEAALDYLDEQTRRADLRLDMDLRAGDIQFINNYTTLHSRTGFVDGPLPHQEAPHAAPVAEVPAGVAARPRFSVAHGLQARAGHSHPRRVGRRDPMPKVLTRAQVDAFERDGYLSPVLR